MNKKNKSRNSNGIVICDSIIMSVRKKRPNVRSLEAVVIALIGYISVIASFLSMFNFNYSRIALLFSAAAFSVLYITLSLLGKKGAWIAAATTLPVIFLCYKFIDSIALGYRFMYNTVYRTAYHTEIAYYKFLKPSMEKSSITAFFILGIWLLALVIYIFTVYRPNSVPPLIVTFPIIEIGLYNGIKLPILWGTLVIAYWLALFAMTATDMGEYSGGNGGFVRKENMFFPKRQMRLKVTEKCGILIIAEVIVIAVAAMTCLKITHYRRSEAINQKRTEVRDAVNSFSMNDFAGSISNLTNAFGFSFDYQNHKLGNVDSLKYKDVTDLTVTFDQKIDGAVYLKDYTGSLYDVDQWLALPDEAYSSQIFKDFEKYSIYPQDMPYQFNHAMDLNNSEDVNIWINSKLKGNRSFAPYGTASTGILKYNHDSDVSSKKPSQNEYSYKFKPLSNESIVMLLGQPVRYTYTPDYISDYEWRQTLTSYCKEHDMLNDSGFISIDSELPSRVDYSYENPENIMAMILQDEYEDFVFENYLKLPDTAEMAEVKAEYENVLRNGSKNLTAAETFGVLNAIRDEIANNVTYTLDPGRTPNNRDFVNYFLLENHKGYCTHYASAGVVLARMAGIPARYATGYVIVGDDFNSTSKNPNGSYTIQVKDNRSHAWIEVYIRGYGWVPYECTAGYTAQAIDTTPTTTSVTTTTTETTTTTTAEQNTTDTNNTTTKPAHGTTTTTVSVSSETTVDSSNGTTVISKPSGHKIHIPDYVKYVLLSLAIIAVIIAAVLIRRKVVLSVRHKRFTEGDTRTRMHYIYGYIEKLLELMEIERSDRSYADFARDIEKMFGGNLFDEGIFAACTDTALRAAFSSEQPESSEADVCVKFAEDFAGKVYERSGKLKKLYIRFISVLV